MIKTFSISDIGMLRQLNQDYVYTSEKPVGNLPNLFVVADGMGGHNAGDYASRFTVETIVQDIMESKESNPVVLLDHGIQKANRLLRKKAAESAALNGMGTTVVIATIQDGVMQVANVGDSRLYVVNDSITQVTRDHSLVEEMVRMGGIDRRSARTHPDKNIITRAVGATEEVRVDYFKIGLEERDTVLMCTDGLTNMLEDEEIRMILEQNSDMVSKAEGLIRAANDNGGKDNVSVVLVRPFA